MTNLRVNEIFCSIQGESAFAGKPCVFVRTTGCPLRCTWCDTEYAFAEGTDMELEEVVVAALSYDIPVIEVTGGEPLAQDASLELLKDLCDCGKSVLLETSGALPIARVDDRVHIVMDIKCPGSGMEDRNLWENLEHLKETDEIKFVIAGREDYEYATHVIAKFGLDDICEVIISPVIGRVDGKDVAQWMLEDKLPARFQLQLHKLIWPPDARGV